MAEKSHHRHRAFVLLARGFGADAWHRRWAEGRIIGINEPFAYGYHHAQDDGIDVHYSQDAQENAIGKMWRLGWRFLLGFDFIHAWRNRHSLFAADVVWTHTESQSLAVGLLQRVLPWRKRPRLILQSVWLMDQWPKFSSVRRGFYRWLLAPADILSFHSSLNTARAKSIFKSQRCEWIRFGISADEMLAPRELQRATNSRINVVSLGSDRHRDWPTLINAVKSLSYVDLTIISGTLPAQLLEGAQNVRLYLPANNRELLATYDASDLVVVPLKENLHASGITVIQEAITRGKPVVATRVGGLEDYFDDQCVTYVPPTDVGALCNAIESILRDNASAHAKTLAAQSQMNSKGISSRAFARQHAQWSIALLTDQVA